MDLVGGYGSAGSSDEDEPVPKKPKISKPAGPSPSPESDGGASKRKVIDFSKLPVRRPVVFDDAKGEAEDAPLRKAAQLESLRGGALNLLAALPPPKVTLGVDVDPMSSGSGSKIDLSEMNLSRKRVEPSILTTPGGIMRGGNADPTGVSESGGEVPEELMKHPMMKNDERAGAGGDRPTAEDLGRMKETKFKTISQAEIADPNWYMNNQVSGGLGLGAGRKVAN